MLLRWRLSSFVPTILLAACGGGTGDSSMQPLGAPETQVSASAADADTAAAAAWNDPSCMSLPPLPIKPANARSVLSFGVVPSDTKDNTAAIQAALDQLKPGEWLVFPAGRYLHSKALRVRVPGVVLWSEGATLVATNPTSTAVMLQADNVGMFRFRLHAVTTTRGSLLEHARITVAPRGTGRVRGVVVRRNIIESSGASMPNGSTASGVIVFRGEDFTVAENYVQRTLADGIHVTGGSRNGRIMLNTLRENGDDMIAVVSYMGDASTPPATQLANLSTLREEHLVRNVQIARNDVAGQYWGRGITVVGGEDITIESNKISDTTYAAGVLLARERSYRTFGVQNVVVRNNTIQRVQTTAPIYSVGDKATVTRTTQAGVEIHSFLNSEEQQYAQFVNVAAVQKIRVENNGIDETLADGVRIGVGNGKVGLVGLLGNRMSNIRWKPINVLNNPTPQYNVYCSGNTDDGNPTSSNLCMGSNPAVTGAVLNCKSTL